jgi:hypothetical protein
MVPMYFMHSRSTGTSFPFSLAASSQTGYAEFIELITFIDVIDAQHLQIVSAGCLHVIALDEGEAEQECQHDELHEVFYIKNYIQSRITRI